MDELAQRNETDQLERLAMRPKEILKQVQLIQQIMTAVMKEGEHYGTIPGTKKPTLYQSGADKLNLTFRLEPRPEIIQAIEREDFISYTAKVSLYHIPTGKLIATGIGSCNSRETKYRYRNEEKSTGQPVPKAYWDAYKKGDNREAKRLLGGDNRKASKIDNQWVIVELTRVEFDNPWDFQNTIIKMSIKRGKVASTISALAAGDIFTQDLEDLPVDFVDGEKNNNEQPPPPKKKTTGKNAPSPLEEMAKKEDAKVTNLEKMILNKLGKICEGSEIEMNERLKAMTLQGMKTPFTFDNLKSHSVEQLTEVLEMTKISFEEWELAQKAA